MTDTFDLGHIASGIDRIERARKTIDRRQYTDKIGGDWTPGEVGDSHPFLVGTYGKAVLDYSEDGQRFQVNGYTYAGHQLFQREYASLDAALRNGTRVANEGPTPAEHVAAWNLTYPEGKAVRYWTGAKEGPGVKGRTRSAATVFSGAAVVTVDGYERVILTHVEPTPESEVGR